MLSKQDLLAKLAKKENRNKIKKQKQKQIFFKQCDQTWPFPANVAVFGVWVAGKIWWWLVAGVAGYYIYVVTSCPGLGIFWQFLTKNIGGWQIWPVLEVPWPVC